MNIQVCIGCAFESHEYSGFKTLSAYGTVESRYTMLGISFYSAGLTCILSTLSIQETSEPLGLKFLRVLGQMTP